MWKQCVLIVAALALAAGCTSDYSPSEPVGTVPEGCEGIDDFDEYGFEEGEVEALCEDTSDRLAEAEKEAPGLDPACHSWADFATGGSRGSDYQSEYQLCMQEAGLG